VVSVTDTYGSIVGFLDRSRYLFLLSSFSIVAAYVVRVLGYRSGGPGSISGTTRKKSSGSGTGSTQPREYN
jgi:hypothetical protein